MANMWTEAVDYCLDIKQVINSNRAILAKNLGWTGSSWTGLSEDEPASSLIAGLKKTKNKVENDCAIQIRALTADEDILAKIVYLRDFKNLVEPHDDLTDLYEVISNQLIDLEAENHLNVQQFEELCQTGSIYENLAIEILSNSKLSKDEANEADDSIVDFVLSRPFLISTNNVNALIPCLTKVNIQALDTYYVDVEVSVRVRQRTLQNSISFLAKLTKQILRNPDIRDQVDPAGLKALRLLKNILRDDETVELIKENHLDSRSGAGAASGSVDGAAVGHEAITAGTMSSATNYKK